MRIRCKFRLTDVHLYAYGGADVTFKPEYDTTIPEDQRFNKASPTGEIKIRVDNPPVVDFYKNNIGKFFYFDSTPVPEPVEASPQPVDGATTNG